MSISTPFIKRPIATSLLTLALALAGGIAFIFLPVAPIPQVEYPDDQCECQPAWCEPGTMASAVATPLERQFGRIAGITEMTSSSNLGNTKITLQFDLNRNIDAAARDVQAAINAARGQLPAMPSNPNYRKVNPVGFANPDSGVDIRRRRAEQDVRHCGFRSWRRSSRRFSGVGQVRYREVRSRPCGSR